MTDEAVESVHDDLLKDIKESLDLLNKDNSSKDILQKEAAKTLKAVQICLSEIKLTITRLKTEQSGFILSHRDRTLNCDKIHNDFEQRLRDHPPELRCAHEKRLEKLESTDHKCVLVDRMESVEDKVEKLTPFMYKVIGAVTVIAILVPPLISGAVAFIIKHMTTKGGL